MNLRSNQGFNAYLEGSKGSHQAKTIRQYAARFGYVLEDGNASDLLMLPPKARLHAMSALAALAKYQRRYTTWKEIKAAYGLKWKYQDDISAFESITQGADLDAMLQWVKKASSIAPAYTNVFRYACLTGLRPTEAFLSLGLANEGYHNEANGTLEHYRFPKIFIRRMKKAHVSVTTPEVLRLREGFDSSKLRYNPLRLILQHQDFSMKMNYCRKIQGTFLKKQGIDTDIIDLLHGRLPTSVFLRFYNRPGFKHEINKVRACLDKLEKEIP